MTQSGSPTKGDIENLHELTDVQTSGVNTSTAITKGKCVYVNGASGLVVVPTSATRPDAGKIRFLPIAQDNTSGSAITDKEAETYKKKCKCIMQLRETTANPGDAFRASRSVAGDISPLPDPATGSGASVISNYQRERLGIILGKPGELEETGNEPSNMSPGDLVVVQWD